MPEKPSLEEQRSATLDTLAEFSTIFLKSRVSIERSAGLDANLNNKHRLVNDQMDYLLERYFSLIGGVELDLPEPQVIIEQHEKDLAWQEYDGA